MNPPPHLANHNHLHRVSSGVWIKDSDASFDYSDGEEAESYVAQSIAQVRDRGSLSTELASKIRDWSSEYHLSPLRSNLLRALNLADRGPILEIGAGCGAITRYLGELNLNIDAVEGSYERACIARLRCADLANVEVHSINVNDLSLPDNHYGLVCFIGVLEYAQRFSGIDQSPEQAVLHLLTKAKNTLRPDGAIVIAIENRLGFKYLFGAGEDHYGLAYEGIHDYPNFEGIKTYSKSTWTALLSKHGLTHEFLYPFPDYKLPEQVLSDHYIEMHPESWGHLTTTNSRDYHELMTDPGDIPFWETVGQAGHLGDFSNSFLIVASDATGTVGQIVSRDFIHVSGMGRNASFRTLTEKVRDEFIVTKKTLACDSAKAHSGILSHRAVYQEPFYAGLSLACHWERKLRVNPDEATLLSLIRPYFEFLQSSIKETDNTGQLLDLTPMNIMVSPTGDFHAFDQEWETSIPLSSDFILFRGLFYFTQSRKALVQRIYKDEPELTLEKTLLRCFWHLGLTKHDSFGKYCEREDLIQNIVSSKRFGLTTSEYIRQPLYADKQVTRLFWAASGTTFDPQNHRRALLAIGNERQTIRFSLPETTSFPLTIRLHPGDTQGYLRIHSITTRYHKDGTDSVLQEFPSGAQIAQRTNLEGLIYGSNVERDIFVAVNSDPHLTWVVDAPYNSTPSGNITVTVELDWTRSPEFRLIRGALLEKQAILARQAIRHKSEAASLIQMRHDLDRIRQSRVMRTAEFIKRLLPSFLFRDKSTPPPYRSSTPRDGETHNKPATPEQRPDTGTHQHLDAIVDTVALSESPLISILMPVFNTPIPWLEAAIRSVQEQTYSNWELCIVNDASDEDSVQRALHSYTTPRIRVRHLNERKNIAGATNEALRMARGTYVLFLDHDDLLATGALMSIAFAINETKADIIYSDEDFIDINGAQTQPNFKPDYSPDLLLAHNYITHLVAVRRQLCIDAGGLRTGYDGAQDYDLLLRLTDDEKRSVHHIPEVLYHWRQSDSSTSLHPNVKPTAEKHAQLALTETLARRHIEGVVESAGRPHFFHIQRQLTSETVSIVIPFKDNPSLLRQCIESILSKTTHQEYEIIAISNNSDSPETFALMDELARRDSRLAFHECNVPFNFSALINFGVQKAQGTHIASINSDVQLISWNWAEALMAHTQRPEVGVVGGKLYFPDNTIQHAGIVIGINGYAGHAHKGRPCNDDGYFHRANLIQNISAVTGAFMMFRKTLFEQIEGFDESYPVACNDVDFCLRAREHGFLNIFTPYAEAYHHESSTRGYEDSISDRARFDQEVSRFRTRHKKIVESGDPYYNVNLSLLSEDFAIQDALRPTYDKTPPR